MADSKITALTALTAADPVNDMFPVVDVSDTTMAASGTTKKISVNNILGASGTATLASATITGALGAAGLNVTGATIPANGMYLAGTNTLGFSANTLSQSSIAPLGVFQWFNGAGGTRMTLNSSGLINGGTTADIIAAETTTLTNIGNIGASYSASTGTYFVAKVNAANGIVELKADARSGAYPPMVFTVSAAEGLRLNANAALVLKGGTTTANGVGVAFPATQVASSDANTLDDYEEGTWTPTIGGTATYTAQTGTYTKVGRLVTASFDITILLRGTGDVNTVSGLPFAASANVGAAVALSYFSGLSTSSASIYGYVNSSTMPFNTIAAGGGTSLSGAAVITNATRLAGTAVYMV